MAGNHKNSYLEECRLTEIIFLGTGGGRFATIFQPRSTGGIYFTDGVNIHIDPGPGALVRMHDEGLDPTKTDAILVSHGHPDHYSDAEVLIEAMTRGCRESKGIIAGSKSVILGDKNYASRISGYHLEQPGTRKSLSPGDTLHIVEVHITATKAFHTDPTTIGFKMKLREGIVSYISDTAFNREVIAAHRDARLLIISVTRPLGGRIRGHLCTEDAADIIKEIKPEIALLTHFGLKVIDKGPEKQAAWIQEKTGIQTIAAEDRMHVHFGKEIEIKRLQNASPDEKE